MREVNDNTELLFPDIAAPKTGISSTTTFVDNMRLPVHRWFRFSAGFSAKWAESVIREQASGRSITVLDPFAGSGTTLLAAEQAGAKGYGVEAHPVVFRIARAKLHWRSDVADYQKLSRAVLEEAKRLEPDIAGYPPLIRRCYDDSALMQLDVLRQAYSAHSDESPSSELVWLTLMGILRSTSCVGTAQWQYVQPNKTKKRVLQPFDAYEQMRWMICQDMRLSERVDGPAPQVYLGDARNCQQLPDESIDLVLTSPPYPNNYDYADATRLEMCFFGEIKGWGDLQDCVRKHLITSCTQHVPNGSVDLDELLGDPILEPIKAQLSTVCGALGEVRQTKGGKKTYHLMVASYFRDLAMTWRALRRACAKGARLCFVIGDSAPYGVYVDVVSWLGRLAVNAGFKSWTFEKTRDRNIKWKNRKHRVPLQEGRLWVR